ncbi:MAG: CatB-related O-acetyltransferase [Candidatus Dormibacteraceae bacterium]
MRKIDTLTLQHKSPRIRLILARRIAQALRVIQNLADEANFRALESEGVVSVGRGSQVCPKVYVYRDPTGKRHGGTVQIGSFCSIAPGVEIFTGGNHHTDWISTYQYRIQQRLPGAWKDGAPTSDGDVNIGHDVWIGMSATILSGVTIGNGAVIGANAVVSRDVRAYAVVVGNPAHEARRRFSDSEIDALEAMAWWDWPWDRIREEVPTLCSTNISEFLSRSALR